MRSHWILERLVLNEVMRLLAAGLGVWAGLLALMQFLRVGELLLSLGLTMGDMALLWLASLPRFLGLALPASLLLASLMSVGRMAAEGEILAARAAGVGPFRLSRGLVLVGCLLAGGGTLFTFHLEPAATRWVLGLIRSAIVKGASHALTPGTFVPLGQMVLVAGQGSPQGRYRQVVLLNLNREKQSGWALLTEHLSLSPGGGRLELTLGPGQALALGGHGQSPLVSFARGDMVLDLEGAVREASSFVDPASALGPGELDRAIRCQGPDQRPRLLMAWHRRLSLPWSTPLFGLLGLALSWGHGRAGRGKAFLLAVFSLTGYYCVLRAMDALFAARLIEAALAAWLPNILLALFVLWLMARRSRS